MANRLLPFRRSNKIERERLRAGGGGMRREQDFGLLLTGIFSPGGVPHFSYSALNVCVCRGQMMGAWQMLGYFRGLCRRTPPSGNGLGALEGRKEGLFSVLVKGVPVSQTWLPFSRSIFAAVFSHIFARGISVNVAVFRKF